MAFKQAHPEVIESWKIKSKKTKAKLQKRYYDENRDRIIERAVKWKRERLKDPIYRMIHSMRNRLGHAVKRLTSTKGHRLPKKKLSYLGCSKIELKEYIESQFKPGMDWNNYGKWHVDHIRPLSSFNLSVEEERIKAFHYSNLQPLWAVDNIKKSDTY